MKDQIWFPICWIAESMEKNLTCVTLNVRGLRDKEKRRKLFYWLQRNNYDIICLQETYCTEEFLPNFNRDWKGAAFHSLSTSEHSKGCCILLSHKIKHDIISKQNTNDGRAVLLNVDINDKLYTLVCAYAPNALKQRIEFFRNLNSWIQKYCLSEDYMIIGGDFNCCESQADKTTALKENTKYFVDFKNRLEISDTWRQTHPNKSHYTYHKPGNCKYGSRIDYILSSKNLSMKIYSSEIYPAPISDHDAVITVFKGEKRPKGKGYWKLNTSILQEENYKDGIKTLIDDTKKEYTEDKQVLWEIIKIRVKEFSIKYCTLHKRKMSDLLRNLELNLKYIKETISQGKQDPKILEQKFAIEKEIESILTYQAKGAQIRSRAKWVDEGERSSSYFLRLEKHHQIGNAIQELYDTDGSIVTNDMDILNVSKTFYESLYSSENPRIKDIEDFIEDTIVENTLNENDKLMCEGEVTQDECFKAIKLMKTNKSPGLDGIPVEFYREFWNEIQAPLIDSFNESFKNGFLPSSQRQAVISLIYKSKDKRDIQNYRPISLTNIDYKILALSLSLRLQEVAHKVINTDQTGFIKNRYIGCNVRLVKDIIEFAEKYDKEGAMLFLDFKKAFDSLEWDFLFQTLKKFNFGDEFIHWVRVLYHNPTAKIKNNNFLSDEFRLARGVRQGCPLSALLFTIAVEIMSCRIRQGQ